MANKKRNPAKRVKRERNIEFDFSINDIYMKMIDDFIENFVVPQLNNKHKFPDFYSIKKNYLFKGKHKIGNVDCYLETTLSYMNMILSGKNEGSAQIENRIENICTVLCKDKKLSERTLADELLDQLPWLGVYRFGRLDPMDNIFMGNSITLFALLRILSDKNYIDYCKYLYLLLAFFTVNKNNLSSVIAFSKREGKNLSDMPEILYMESAFYVFIDFTEFFITQARDKKFISDEEYTHLHNGMIEEFGADTYMYSEDTLEDFIINNYAGKANYSRFDYSDEYLKNKNTDFIFMDRLFDDSAISGEYVCNIKRDLNRIEYSLEDKDDKRYSFSFKINKDLPVSKEIESYSKKISYMNIVLSDLDDANKESLSTAYISNLKLIMTFFKYNKFTMTLFDRNKKLEESIQKEKERTEKYRSYSRELKQKITSVQKQMDEYDENRLVKLQSEINKKTSEVSKLTSSLSELRQEFDRKNDKDDKIKEKIRSLSEENIKLREKILELENRLRKNTRATENEASALPETKERSDTEELYSEENLKIAREVRFAFFVPKSYDTAKLKKLFSTSKFFCVEERGFTIGSSTDAVVHCIKFNSHATTFKIDKQCRELRIPCIRVNSLGIDRFFRETIEGYKKTIDV